MKSQKEIIAISIMAILFLLVGYFQSWSLSLSILNMCIISAIMSMGINMQWGYAGIFNVGIMGFTALGGLAAVLVSHSPIVDAWNAGGSGIIILRSPIQASATTGSPSASTSGSDYIYQFTGSGSITF